MNDFPPRPTSIPFTNINTVVILLLQISGSISQQLRKHVDLCYSREDLVSWDGDPVEFSVVRQRLVVTLKCNVDDILNPITDIRPQRLNCLKHYQALEGLESCLQSRKTTQRWWTYMCAKLTRTYSCVLFRQYSCGQRGVIEKSQNSTPVTFQASWLS